MGEQGLVVWGIPSCGTVRKAQGWLDAQGLPYQKADLRESPPSAERIARWAAAFGAKALRNTSGGSYRALGPDKDSYSDAQWIQAFAADPMLIKRPVIELDGAPVLVGFNAPEAELRRRLGLDGG